ncbi:CpaF family protein [Phenylobacterium soli]|uniref:CpaF family protein n=1 Tax=Phenylobacterium soli TaxID=2170551 RepID=A0A328AG88_9CAUL|nr:CpaF family protein [Phenylobacterium soli]RAK51828.1 CpaF family protein [Phenylobacterium soli]
MFGRRGLSSQSQPSQRAEAPALDAAPLQPPLQATVLDLASHRPADPAAEAQRPPAQAAAKIREAASAVQSLILQRIDSEVASRLDRDALAAELAAPIQEILVELKVQLNQREQQQVLTLLLDDMLGLGPLEPLLADDSITDIMVNGPGQIYVEQRGKLVLTDATFRDDNHVMSVASRIVSQVGRRVDESTPLVDARLADGSRVNIIIPPLALDGASISIRKFAKRGIDLDRMTRQGNLSAEMATVLKIASRARLNILISGGTGSGKTTLLNALSHMIAADERVVTIEDAAELQLQQPHVVRLETRPPNLEGRGEINMRDLVKNALRMRPDRIILGEIRGAEALDMLQAMNTGHDGSLGTIHANRPREALTRLENMVAMSGVNLPSRAVRTQIAAAVNMIVQISRMRDGVRRITSITEVVGMEGEVITTQELFAYRFEGESTEGKLLGSFDSAGLRPFFSPRAAYFGLERPLLEAIG